jgi:hypothetical protein
VFRLKKPTLLVVAFLGVFSAGWAVGKLPLFASATNAVAAKAPLVSGGESGNHALPSGDVVKMGASSTTSAKVEETPDSRFDLYDVKKRAELESYLQKIPFAVLKGVYLEREDVEFLKVSSRYEDSSALGEKEKAERTAEIFDAYQKNAGAKAHFYAEGEWKLRGGRVVPYRAFANYYSSQPIEGKGGWVTTSPPQVKDPSDFCWYVGVFFLVGSKYELQSNSTCLGSTPLRDGAPFAFLQAYRKSLAPYFDSVAVPLPGFGTEESTTPEWYDSTRASWSALSSVRWEPRDPAVYQQLEKDTRALGQTE